ncbi:hypothetical protein HYT51_00740 [Candidatus Woesearchaeota archaeon]|nr:hypothetical protein [Candidatus Woesearchaeota archaeon]
MKIPNDVKKYIYEKYKTNDSQLNVQLTDLINECYELTESKTKERDKVTCFGDSSLYLVWAEPDEGRYNYCFYPIHDKIGHEIEIPDTIKLRIKESASSSYPIAIVTGTLLDKLIDKLNDQKYGIMKTFGLFPRKVFGTSKDDFGDSVQDFIKAQESKKK